jgi:hypothetical protein
MSSVRKHMKACCLLFTFVKQMLSRWLVATRHSSRNLAHACISNTKYGFSHGLWALSSR